jgi:hypothetical protein
MHSGTDASPDSEADRIATVEEAIREGPAQHDCPHILQRSKHVIEFPYGITAGGIVVDQYAIAAVGPAVVGSPIADPEWLVILAQGSDHASIAKQILEVGLRNEVNLSDLAADLQPSRAGWHLYAYQIHVETRNSLEAARLTAWIGSEIQPQICDQVQQRRSKEGNPTAGFDPEAVVEHREGVELVFEVRMPDGIGAGVMPNDRTVRIQ